MYVIHTLRKVQFKAAQWKQILLETCPGSLYRSCDDIKLRRIVLLSNNLNIVLNLFVEHTCECQI